MSWLFETKIRHSKENGTITATRRWGTWVVTVDGSEQTGPQTHALWKNVIKKIKEFQGSAPMQNVLMLGLGGGGEIKTFHKNFKDIQLSVVEYDVEMIALAKELSRTKSFPFPHIFCGDASKVVPELKEKYDLIIVDLFRGKNPSAHIADPPFLASLDALLTQNGFIVLNAFEKEQYLSLFKSVFSTLAEWKFGLNHMGIFQKKFLAPKEGYLPLHAWPEYDPVASVPKFLHPAHIGAGAYWKFWPFTFEEYRGDSEPVLAELPNAMRAPLRIVMWQRFFGQKKPEKWISFSRRPFFKIGITKLVSDDYSATWTKTLRQNRRDWLATYLGKKYAIESIPFDEFKKTYAKSTLPYFIRQDMPHEIASRLDGEAPPVFWGARRIADRILVGAIAVIESPSRPVSYYFAGCYTKEAGNDPVMVGLMDKWFSESLKNGIVFLDFGIFWKKGEIRSWKGFSLFKSKFHPTYFFYPPKLYQFRWNKKT